MAAVGDQSYMGEGPGGPRQNDLPAPPPASGQNEGSDPAYKQTSRQVLSSDVSRPAHPCGAAYIDCSHRLVSLLFSLG